MKIKEKDLQKFLIIVFLPLSIWDTFVLFYLKKLDVWSMNYEELLFHFEWVGFCMTLSIILLFWFFINKK